MQQSYEEIRKTSINENITLYHPYIKFVSFHGKKCYCEEHPEMVNMNLGAIKQHIEGSDHNLNFETGEPLDTYFENNSKALDEQSSLNENLTKPSSKDELKELVISRENDHVLKLYLTSFLYEGKQRDEKMAKLTKAHLIEQYGNNIMAFLIKNKENREKEGFKEIYDYMLHAYIIASKYPKI